MIRHGRGGFPCLLALKFGMRLCQGVSESVARLRPNDNNPFSLPVRTAKCPRTKRKKKPKENVGTTRNAQAADSLCSPETPIFSSDDNISLRSCLRARLRVFLVFQAGVPIYLMAVQRNKMVSRNRRETGRHKTYRQAWYHQTSPQSPQAACWRFPGT